MRILLIDDDPFVLRVLQHLLSDLGCDDVMTCGDSMVAERYLRSGIRGIDLILCDLQMPGRDGVEMIRYLADVQFAGKLALVSGEDTRTLRAAEQLALARRLDIVGVLPKPVSREQLAELVVAARGLDAAARGPGDYFDGDSLFRAIVDDQLLNYYQPLVELASGRIIGFEAMVRWQHPDYGMLQPANFLAAFDENMLGDDLLRAVLGNALREAPLWRGPHQDHVLSIHASLPCLEILGLPDQIARAVERSGLPAEALAIEVKAGVLPGLPTVALDVLARLRLKRIPIIVDDYRTARNAQFVLQAVPADTLKFEAGILRRAACDPLERASLVASAAFAGQSGIRTVAKWVESEADWDLAIEAGCTWAQGMFIGAPIPAERIDEWRREWADCCRMLYG